MMLANDRAGLHDLGPRHRRATRRTSACGSSTRKGRSSSPPIPAEAGQRVDTTSEACFKCHAAGQPIEKLPPGDRTRTFTLDGVPALGVIRPIENEPACSTAACHAHPPEKRLLGVLDVSIQLVKQEEIRRQTTALMAATGLATLVLVAVVVILVVQAERAPAGPEPRRDARRPGQRRLLGALRGRVDRRVRLPRRRASTAWPGDLQKANAELVEWAQTLERRVEEKTAELRRRRTR